MHDRYGLPLLDCSRGTNSVEGFHKSLHLTFAGWSCGVEMADYLLAERRHRHNLKVSEAKRLAFPCTNHFDSWLTDWLQDLVFKNHGVTLYPGWINARDFGSTEETFGTVPLQSEQLQRHLNDTHTLTDEQLIMLCLRP